MIPNPSSPEKQKGGGGTVKLRDSCHACAASKLKCPKERPTCSRCAKRDIPCTYVESKRKGRKSQSSQSTTSNISRSSDLNIASRNPSVHGGNFPTAAASTFPPVPTPDVAPMASPANPAPTAPMATSTPSTIPSFSPGLGAQSLFPGDNSMFMDDFLAPLREPWSSIGSVSGDSSTYSANTLFPAGHSELLGKYGDGSIPLIPDNLDADTWSWALSQDTDMSFTDLINSGKDNVDLSIGPIHFFGNSNAESTVASSASSINQFAALNGTELAQREDHAPESCCMLRAMSFMKQIGVKSRAGSQDSTAMDICGDSSTTQSMITNTIALDVVREILDCSCGSHGHIQVLVSLIILRLLHDYATEARQDSSTQSLLATTGSKPFEEASPTYMAAQRVLGELHCVQRLVAQLSSRIHEARGKSDAAAAAQVEKPGDQEANGMIFSFSPGTLDQIEMDVRGRLGTLSKKLIAVLREE